MALTVGARVGAYEIVGLLGAGGMGEVYRARDTKLNRDVALKILPDAFASDPDRLARFTREAQTLAALNHPNIAQIYGLERLEGQAGQGGQIGQVGQVGPTAFIVMELVEGEDLVRRIARGAIPVDEALPIARQIAEALEAAHEQGIIHRDLKPANVKLRPDGAVKVLDFGLAKALDAGSGPAQAGHHGGPAPTMLPTLTFAGTQAGLILGTAAYMSPEQARGVAVDRRADVWAFGVVLFEMLTARRPFTGDTISDTLASVLKTDVTWDALPPTLPAGLGRLLRRCLEKDPKRRLQAIGEARVQIEDVLAGAPADIASATRSPLPRSRILPWATAGGLGAGLIAALLIWAPWRPAPAPAVVRARGELGIDASLPIEFGSSIVLSPNGSTLVFVAQKKIGDPTLLYVRRLDHLETTSLAGTEDAHDPFFSPDGQWIGFFAGRKLKKIAVTGGASAALADAPEARGGAWASDGTILFQPDLRTDSSLMRVSAAGGKPERAFPPDRTEFTQRWPQILPGGKAVLYTASGTLGPGAGFNDADIVVRTLPGGSAKVVQHGGFYARYLPSGHLIFAHEATLLAAPFDLDRLEVNGPLVPVIDGVTTSPLAGGAQFDVAGDGTLVYEPGLTLDLNAAIYWMDRKAAVTPLRGARIEWSDTRFSPDGRQIAMDVRTGQLRDVWTFDWARDTMSRLTFDSDNASPAWSPDGRYVVYASKRGDKKVFNLYVQRADGTGDAVRLTESANHQIPTSWHPSGKYVAFSEQHINTNFDLMILPMEGDDAKGWKAGGAPAVFLGMPAVEQDAQFSPDGRWLAYHSDETGRNEIYVRPFPGPGGKRQVSSDGGTYATWSRAKRELLFGAADLRIMNVPYTVDGDSFRAEKPRPWSDGHLAPGLYRRFDLHPDGERVAAGVAGEGDAKRDKLVFVFNFFQDLRRLAPPQP